VLIEKIKAWWARPTEASCMVVERDNGVIRVLTLPPLDPGFHRQFRWEDITRVCFEDGGISLSDLLFIECRNQEKPAVIFTEAKGAAEFLAELVQRGLFPETIFKKAIGSSGGGMYCWPPKDSE